jgi:hypothetical protein
MLGTVWRWVPAILLASALAVPPGLLDPTGIQKLLESGDYRAAESSARAALVDLEKQPEALQTARLLELLAKAQIGLARDLDQAEKEALKVVRRGVRR